MTLTEKDHLIFRTEVRAAFAAALLVVPAGLHAEMILERRLTTDSADQISPAIYEDRVVWQDFRHGNGDIYLYDLTTNQERRLTTDPGLQECPAVWRDRVVWRDTRSGRAELYLYDLTTNTERRLASNPELLGCPSIHGDRVVWVADNFSRDLYLYDLSTSTQQRVPVPNANDRKSASIWGNRIVRQDWINPGPWHLYVYDLATGIDRRVGTTTANQEQPSIWEDRVVAHEYRVSDPDIYLYDLSTGQEQAITIAPFKQLNPRLHGDRMVWTDWRTTRQELYLFNLSTGREQLVSSSRQNPAVWGNRIVTQGYANNHWDIFVADLSQAIVPRHQLAAGTDVYHMVNFPWGKYFDSMQKMYVYTYGMDFGSCPLLNARRVVNNPQVATDLDTLRSAGVEGIRWFLIPDGRNLTFDANRVPTGRGAGFREDLWSALDLLSARQMSLIMTLIDGNTWFKPPSEWQGALFGHGELILNPAKRQAFYDTVLIPILRDVADWAAAHPSEPFPVAAIDVGNELHFGTNAFQGTGVMITDMQTYVREVAALIHQHLPGIPVTVGEAGAETLVDYWIDPALGVAPGQGLDFYSFHHYGSQPLQGPNGLRAQYGLDQLGKRIYLQEFPGKNAALGDPGIYLAPIGGTRPAQNSTGWLSGSYLWSFNGADDQATPIDPVATLQQIADWFANAFSAPDFIIPQLGVPLSPPVQGDPVQFNVQVANRGGVLGGANRFELWLDGVQLSAQTLAGIEEGDTVTLAVPQPPWIATTGSHSLWAKADVWLQVVEADEQNNEATATVVVNPGLPDLVIAALTYPATIRSGDRVRFSVVVKNQGAVASGANRMEMWLDGVQLAAARVRLLAPGASATLKLPRRPWVATPGSHSLWTKADVRLQVSEDNEANNERNQVITVR